MDEHGTEEKCTQALFRWRWPNGFVCPRCEHTGHWRHQSRALLPHLNDIYCYFTYQGDWRTMSPDDATAAKRTSDRVVFSNFFLWSKEFLEAYEEYTRTAFLEHRGEGRQFLFRTSVARHRENPKWEDSWYD